MASVACRTETIDPLPNVFSDFLTCLIPEHPGRVHAAGTGVGIQDYFRSSSRQTSYAYIEAQEQRLTQEITKKLRANLREELRTELRTELREELYNEVTTEVTDRVMHQFQQQFESYGMRPLPSPVQEHVVPPTGRSGKGSCSTPIVPGDDMDDASPCLLNILDGTGTMLVARGTVFQATTIAHGMELSEDETHAQEKIRLSEDDPLGALQQLVDIIANKPLEVEYDANVFGRDSEVPIYLHSQDVRELASGTEELNITLVQLWMIYLFGVSNNLGYNDVYGFIDPQVIHETNDFDEITTYLTSRFASGKNIHFIPYIFGSISTSMMLVGRSIANSRKLALIALKRFKTPTPIPEKPLTFLRKAIAKHLFRLYNSS
ncbi:hypothetical protein LR48_Vigan01g081100 [Vigna angularis]|uniref:Uncharacterized protein n=1 Tax=Phaseolus angularis TaxID=3914 RepID=A0A0L9TLA1_PHAAN|nr:hypothetical protein LR48_Vigan01g081100 [Vigna angularis]